MASTLEAASAGTVVANKAQPRQLRTTFPEVIEAKVTVTEASLAAAVTSQVDITVAGAQVGDWVLVSADTTPVGLAFSGLVKSANTVQVNVRNMETTDANTAASGGIALNVLVLRKRSGFANN